MEYHASLFLSQPNSNSAHFSVLLFYEHCANDKVLFYYIEGYFEMIKKISKTIIKKTAPSCFA